MDKLDTETRRTYMSYVAKFMTIWNRRFCDKLCSNLVF